MDQEYFSHPLLKERSLLFRQYQNTVLEKTLYKNSLIVVPTSLGKTIITLLICVDILYKWKKSKILVLAPTRPLVHQHLDLFRRFTVVGNNCIALTGKISPEIRKTIWKSRSIRIYFATPELVRNDIDSNILKKDEFYLVVFDEAHRAVKDYSYTSISSSFYDNVDSDKIPLILALTASPGSNGEKIKKICSNLYIEQIIVKSEGDEDVLPYIYNIDIKHNLVDLDNEHKEISNIFQSLIDDKIRWLVDNNFIKKKKVENVYRKDLLNLADYLKSMIPGSNSNNNNNKDNSVNFFLYAALKYQSMAMILLYCRDLIESQGGFSLKKFFNKFENEVPNKTYQELLSDPRIQKVIGMLKNDKASSHPKLQDTLSIVKDFLYKPAHRDSDTETNHKNEMPAEKHDTNTNNDNRSGITTEIGNLSKRKILIFSQYRDTLEEITNLLNKNDILCKGFYGQSSKKNQKGINQDKQLSILNDFKKGTFSVLVATSVAEEGLDIPNVDLVIFYEPVPSEIRFIQRRGRTGRFSDGKVIVLVTNNSIDSKYLEIAQKKIVKMKHILKDINFILNTYSKRSFDVPDMMSASEIGVPPKKPDTLGDDDGASVNDGDIGTDEFFNPIMDSISSNSDRKVKYFLKKLSYEKKDTGDQKSSSSSKKDLELLYDVSLALDSKKMIEKAQRQIHNLLAKSGKNGMDVSYLHELLKFDRKIIKKAIENLEKIKRVVWIDNKTVSLADSVKFIPGKKYSIFIEKVLYGKAIVVVDQKWYASLNYFDYAGPRTLLKKGNSFDIIGDVYKKNGILHLMVKKTM
ncbi:MAG: DEAD/DEAH box helicase family protein [Nitrosopumilus sp.]|nr:DEAD/DEAH box helicase family protein [Nitrosopumilus sp.]